MADPRYCSVRRHFCDCEERCDSERFRVGAYFRPTMTCAMCHTESALYEALPHCRECMEVCCERCGQDYDAESGKLTCNRCTHDVPEFLRRVPA